MLASWSPLGLLCLWTASACRTFRRVRDCPSWSTLTYGWVLQHWLHTETYNNEINADITHQNKIGIVAMMAQGFLSKHWIYAVHPSRDAQCTMNKIQCMIWMNFVEPLWSHRNDLVDQSTNHLTQVKENKLAKSITWYCAHCHTILSGTPWSIPGGQHQLETLHNLPLKHKHEWMCHLEIGDCKGSAKKGAWTNFRPNRNLYTRIYDTQATSHTNLTKEILRKVYIGSSQQVSPRQHRRPQPTTYHRNQPLECQAHKTNI
jgi:hypothetical protein